MEKSARSSSAVVHKGYSEGCPSDVGQPITEMAFNLGCLPGVAEVNVVCEGNNTAWACHSEPDKVCCGHAARRHLPLEIDPGIHFSSPVTTSGP